MSKEKKKTSSSLSNAKTEVRGAPAKAAKEEPDIGSVEKIRDIIFGNQMRDYDTRFSRLEERLIGEVKDLREETGKRLDSIEQFIKKEIESLSERLDAEQKQRAEKDEALSKDLKENLRSISKTIERLDEKQIKDTRDLRQQLLDQSKNLSNQILDKHKESSIALDQNVQELRADKVNRSALSELLMEMAVRVSDELAEKLNVSMDELKNE